MAAGEELSREQFSREWARALESSQALRERDASLSAEWARALESTQAQGANDAYFSVFDKLPEYSHAAVYQDNLDITLDTIAQPRKVRPIALVGAALLVRELVRGMHAVSAPHLLLRGSVYIPDLHKDEYKDEDIIDAIEDEEEDVVGGVESFITVNCMTTDEDQPFLYMPRHFRRDALIVYSKVYTLEAMQLARFQRQTVGEGTEGRVVTVSQPPYAPFPIFIESERQLMTPLKQLYAHKRSERIRLLSHPLE